MPPYSSGTSTAVKPSSADFRRMDAARPGSCRSMRSLTGSISRVTNSAAARAMARWSSLKSSGVKISSGAALLRRNAPPFSCGVADVEVAMILLRAALENTGRALAAAHAHGHHSPARIAPLHLAQQRGGELRPRAAQRMPQRDGAAVRICLPRIESRLAHDCERLHREGFVEFQHGDIVERDARAPQRLRNCAHRTDSHDLRRHSRDIEGSEAGFRAKTQ